MRNTFENKRKLYRTISIFGVITALVLLIGSFIFMHFFGKGKSDTRNGRSEANQSAVPSVVAGDEAENTSGADVPDHAADELNADKNTDNSLDGNFDEIAAEVTVPPVAVAPVDDDFDPQPMQSGGVVVDMSEISGPDTASAGDKKEDNGNNADGGKKKDGGNKADSNKKSDVVTYGIDVAKWQGVIDWKLVKESGVDFAMIRVGYRTQVDGKIYEDPYAKYNLQQAEANGVMIGVYFFSTAVNKKEAIEEAKWVTEFIAAYPITYPVAYNCEGFSSPDSRQYKLSKDERTDIAMAFLDYIREQGYEPMFYAAKNELENNAQWNTDKLSRKYKIWVAQYPLEGYSTSSRSTYNGKHDMWQYTNKGEVKGIKGEVDINIAYFAYDSIAKPKKNIAKEQVEADPYALIKFTEVDEIVTAKEITNLRSVPSSADADTIVAVLKNGETARRIGIGDNGWSKLEYNGKTVYAVSSYLTTDLTVKAVTPTPAATAAGIKFTEVNEQVTAKDRTNLRSEPSTKSADTIVEVLVYGDIAIRTGISENGWSRVEYKGQILYAVSSYLTTDLNYKENNTPSPDNPEAGISFTEVNEKVTAKELTNLRSVPSTASPDTIVVTLRKGDIAIRTGIGSNGWSRVEYNGQVLYAVTSYLELVEEE